MFKNLALTPEFLIPCISEAWFKLSEKTHTLSNDLHSDQSAVWFAKYAELKIKPASRS